MSWQAYVDDNLVGTGKVAKAAIFGTDGSLWASSAGYNVEPVEIQRLIAAFDNSDDIAANGLYLEGKKFFYLRSGDASIYARLVSVSSAAHNGDGGVTCVKTNKAILLGHYATNTPAGDSTVVVESLGDYLRGTGFVSLYLVQLLLGFALVTLYQGTNSLFLLVSSHSLHSKPQATPIYPLLIPLLAFSCA
ncbi:MAG: profilin [Linnemannia gamsii]|nr:MAG: profilin [Linnemannia gamsii]